MLFAQNIKNKQTIKKLVENQFIIQYNKNVDTFKKYADSTPSQVMMTTGVLLKLQSAQVSQTCTSAVAPFTFLNKLWESVDD